MPETIEKKAKEDSQILNPKFINPYFLTYEQLTDPDYRLKQLQKKYGGENSISCSRCHHCK